MWFVLLIAHHPLPDEPLVHDFRERALVQIQTPYAAWSNRPAAHIRKAPMADALDVGLVRRGDWVIVRECIPRCDDPSGWALLDPFGAVRLADLSTGPQPSDMLAQATFQRFLYGTVQQKGAKVYAEPDEGAAVLKRYPKKYVLAFRDELGMDGWLQRPSRGWVKAVDVRLAKASDLRGVHDPDGALAFILSDHKAVRAYGLEGDSVLVEGGRRPRSSVRLAFSRRRPPQVKEQQKWVHVDLREQVLTAYEGDTWVFATLVSTGKGRNFTKPGIFRVQQKVAHTSMDSERDRYYVDEVPYIQYFNDSQGFHAAFWHDRFGTPVSHGCVNLSVEDAAWLFEWSTPRLPEGWQSVISHNANLASLWVHIEKRPGLGEFALPVLVELPKQAAD